MSQPAVLKPFTFPRTGHVAPNRMVVAAMTNKQSHADGSLSDAEHDWLVARAEGGFGIVTTCAAHVALDGQGWEGEMGVHDDALLPGLTRLASSLRAHGSLSLAQIFHAGVRAPSTLTGEQPWSASAFTLEAPGFEPPRAATETDIARSITAFAEAARRCADAGFDGVELHGAHGYLLGQFLGTVTNTRSDRWGGDLQGRMRFPREVYAAVRAAVPERFLVGIRLSPEVPDQGVAFDDALATAKQFVDDGVDFLHASHWDSWKAPDAHPDSDVPLTTWYREALGPDVPLMATGAVWTPAQADTLLDQGADFVGVARAAIAHPDWPRRASEAGWDPQRPPYTPERLRDAALSETFVEYMRRWPGFVTDGKPAPVEG